MNLRTDNFNVVYQELRSLESALLAESEKRRRGEPALGRGEQLDAMLKQIRIMKEQMENKTLPPPGARIRGMASIVVDSWPLNSKIGQRVVSVEQVFLKLP
ncbi:hypothetical protein [Pseudomonas laurylsulfatiphila]|uniref:hypothetical protein n=1 Tax=Pseudomonas laurylsulfatiphila TaxID=2011015 RepID=UPI003D1B908A|nr:hypothetical protein [Pseudomonas reinekei]